MQLTSWNQRFFETTRGRIVELLRGRARTVDELAGELSLTDNAVRAHLATLERDGLVRQEGTRRGTGAGKPALLYSLAPDVEPLFSSAYLPLLLKTVETMAGRLSASELRAIMREAGRRLGEAYPPGAGDVHDRTRMAAALLEELGGRTTVTEEGRTLVIRGAGCPLSALTSRHAEPCAAIEALLEEVVGRGVRERCERGERPRCRFHIPLASGPRRR